MPAYDGVHFDPPAPVARVVLRCPQTGRRWAKIILEDPRIRSILVRGLLRRQIHDFQGRRYH